MFKILGSLAALFLSGSSSMFGGGKGIDFKGIQAGIMDDLAMRTRKPVMLVLLGFCSILFFCGGAFMAIVDATRQYDRTGHVYATATLWAGVILAAVTLGAYIWVFMHEWPGLKKVHAQKKAREEAERNQQHAPSDIEGALAAILMDFLETRRSRREHRYAEREARHVKREARRAARDAERESRRSARFEQQENWTNQEPSSSDPQRH